MIRALVVDDSPTARALLVEILRGDAGISVVGEASNGVEALEMTGRLSPDVITMDIRMPAMDGFEATRAIMAERPTPIVVVTAGTSGTEVETSMQALRLGALGVLAKPVGPQAPDFHEQCRRLVQTVKLMAGVKVVRRRFEAERPAKQPPSQLPARIVGIAASTGGPAVLSRILGGLTPDFALPVLVVQHIAPGFVDGFATWLNGLSAVPVRVARQGESLVGRTVFVAPEDRHLVVEDRSRLLLSSAPHESGFRPSGTRMFESLAASFGRTAVGVVLTGMGDDGIAGLRAIRAAGGRVLAQDEATSVVFGMPGAAISAGVTDEVLGTDAIARRLEELAARS